MEIPHDLTEVLDAAWSAARNVPGYLFEEEARFLGMVAACVPSSSGAIVEIGSFKGKSTVMLAKVARHYGRGPIVAIDPHNFNSPELESHRSEPGASSFEEFTRNLEAAQVSDTVEVHRAFSSEVAGKWTRPIGFLWIDGDHGYPGAKADFDGFAPHLTPGGIVALHDALHEFSGPIRVFVEDVLRSDRFGAAGFVRSLAWSQFRPEDGSLFRAQRQALDQAAMRLLPLVEGGMKLHGLQKLRYKWTRSRVPRSAANPQAWADLLNRPIRN